MPPHRPYADPASPSFIVVANIEALLAPYVDDPRERSWLARCLVETGPSHHRGANYVLLTMLAELLEHVPGHGAHERSPADAVPVPMRIPPHLRDGGPDDAYPLGVPREALAPIAPNTAVMDEMVASLVEGPPQHALANTLMVHLLRDLRRCLVSR